ncbi:MAG: hypothetical protein ACOCWQ_05945 [Nanoarchaeota archaeon]
MSLLLPHVHEFLHDLRKLYADPDRFGKLTLDDAGSEVVYCGGPHWVRGSVTVSALGARRYGYLDVPAGFPSLEEGTHGLEVQVRGTDHLDGWDMTIGQRHAVGQFWYTDAVPQYLQDLCPACAFPEAHIAAIPGLDASGAQCDEVRIGTYQGYLGQVKQLEMRVGLPALPGLQQGLPAFARVWTPMPLSATSRFSVRLYGESLPDRRAGQWGASQSVHR